MDCLIYKEATSLLFSDFLGVRMGQGAAILPDGAFSVSWGRDLCEGCFMCGEFAALGLAGGVSVLRIAVKNNSGKQPKSNSLSALKQKEFQAKMGYTFALEIFFFQPVSEGKLAVSLWGGNYCTATTKQRRVH